MYKLGVLGIALHLQLILAVLTERDSSKFMGIMMLKKKKKKKKKPKKKDAKLKYVVNLATLVEIFTCSAVIILFLARTFVQE